MKMISTASAAAIASLSLVLAAGCAQMRAPSGNQTSYTTGSYRMPAKSEAATGTASAPVAVQRNGDATAQEARTRTSAPVDAGTVQAAQQALARAGYNPGHADGKWDGTTESAVAQFQRSRGLRESGQLDSATMSALGVPMH